MEQTAEKPVSIYRRLVAILREVGAIEKLGRNEKQGYNFRGIEHVMNELHPCFAKHGVFIEPEVLELNREKMTNQAGTTLIFSIIRVRYAFTDEDGAKTLIVAMGEGMDTGDKSLSKAMSAAFKSALQQMFLIATKDMDDADADGDPGADPDRGSDKPPAGRGRRTTAKNPPIPPPNPIPPFDPLKWRETVWHRKEGTFGEKSAAPGEGTTMKGIHFKGYTLAQILQFDPESFAYWVKEYGPRAHDETWTANHKEGDINLVRALAAAMDELDDLPYPPDQEAENPPMTAAVVPEKAQQAAAAPESVPAPTPQPAKEAAPAAPVDPEEANRAKLIATIRKSLPIHGQDEGYIMALCKQYNYTPPTSTKLEQVPTDKLQSLIKNWKAIEGWAKKRQQEGQVA